MALQSQNQAFHNRMLGQRNIQSQLDQSLKEEADAERAAKRIKTQHTSSSTRTNRTEIPDSDEDEDEDNVIPILSSTNGLESALPDIRTDQEAIDEYEAQRAAEQSELNATEGSPKQQQMVRGKSSIYLDAFNLALQTVLEEESHLFDDAEKALFVHWNSLGYEAQYLFVLLLFQLTLSNSFTGMYAYFFERPLHGIEPANSDITVILWISKQQ